MKGLNNHNLEVQAWNKSSDIVLNLHMWIVYMNYRTIISNRYKKKYILNLSYTF